MDFVARNKAIGGGPIPKITVKSSPLSDIMKRHGVPRYGKIDIAGNDLDALKSFSNAATVPRFLSIESEKRNWRQLVEEVNILSGLGYRRVKIIDQSLVYLQKYLHPPQKDDTVTTLSSLGAADCLATSCWADGLTCSKH